MQTWTTDATNALTENRFTRSDYTFSEWNTREDGTGDSYEPGADYTLATNQNFYAQWTANSGPIPGPEPQPSTSGETTLARTGSHTLMPIGAALGTLLLGALLLTRKRWV